MTLGQYKNLIRNLPHLDQAFETKKSTWQQHIRLSEIFLAYCNKHFTSDTIKLSRLDVFNSCRNDFVEGLFATIMWGYPRNMRGNNFMKILSALPSNKIQSCFPEDKNLSESEFIAIAKKLKSTGIGLSTYSKLLYFFGYTVERTHCLILDRRIIEVLNDKNVFTELQPLTQLEGINEYNKLKKYVSYLQVMAEVSRVNNYKSDQLELFLFLMGRNLKSG